MKLVVKLLIALLTATLQAQELKVAALFSDHMVLQRGQPVPVWGWSVPREEISVSFAGQRKTRKTDTNGKWLVSLDAVPDINSSNLDGLPAVPFRAKSEP